MALEVRQGLVTIEGARNYGVVLTPTGDLEVSATTELRAEMKANRGNLELFDFGPSIDELRENCETETGLAAPVQPVWRSQSSAVAAE